MKQTILVTISLFFLHSTSLLANTGADDFLRSTGKIYSVVAVVLILFFVILFFLIRMESKISKLEKLIKDE